MEYDKFDRQLRLMILLTQNMDYSVENICEKLNMSRRTIYRYLDAFRQMGFKVIRTSNVYRLDKSSPFFQQLSDIVHFTEEEAFTINRVLNSIHDNSEKIRALRWKLGRLYNYKVLAEHSENERAALNIHQLYDAIKRERTVILKEYKPTGSSVATSHIIEPYMLTNDSKEVRGFEITSKENKMFKIACIERVEIMDILWSYKSLHLPYFTDMFRYSGEHTMPVELRLSSTAANFLIQEFPDSAHLLKLEADGRSYLKTEVCSFKGVGRFVMGLLNEVEIIGSPEFLHYMREQVRMVSKVNI